jgi:glycosyltransferase involved in cell wall biosynthesis
MPHGMLDPYSLSVKRRRKAFYLWAFERTNISSAHRLIYTTAEEARLAETQLSSLPEGVVIPLGGDVAGGNADELKSQFLERFPKARNRRQLLFIGRLHFKKGLDRILLALPAVIKAIPDILLTVVGDGEPKYEAALKNAIRAYGLENNVMMTGRLEGAAKWGAYASAELFLLPSRQENFALTVAEAMQMGVPVIISNKVNTWPYVKDAAAGLIFDEAGIEADLGNGTISLLQDVERRRLMGEHGRAYASKHLTWAKAAVSMLNCYDQVLSGVKSRDLKR